MTAPKPLPGAGLRAVFWGARCVDKVGLVVPGVRAGSSGVYEPERKGAGGVRPLSKK